MKKIAILILFLLAISVGYIMLSTKELNTKENKPQEVLVLTPQIGAINITIKKAILEKPGFIAIKETINGKPGQIVEVSEYLTEGTHTTIEIPLPAPVPGKGVSINEAGRPVTVEMVAVMYADNGDKGFNPSDDTIVYVNNVPVAISLTTGLRIPESALVPQRANNTTASTADVTVIYTDEGFSPKEVTVSLGDTVEWINKSSRPMWVASNDHPAHTILPSFDQFTTSAVGESYQYTFEDAGEWVYHDHVNASRQGVIKVLE